MRDVAEVAEAAARGIGFRLFTILVFLDEGREMVRVYSSDTTKYPLGGRKIVADAVSTDWAEAALVTRTPYLGRTAEDVTRVFQDAELISTLGCGSFINAPVVYRGQTVAALNLLDAEGAYGERELALSADLADHALGAVMKAKGDL